MRRFNILEQSYLDAPGAAALAEERLSEEVQKNQELEQKLSEIQERYQQLDIYL